MSDWEHLVAQFFMRTISGVFALVLGTGLSYFLFISSFLRGLEHYKEKIRVHKELDKRCAEISSHVELLLDEHRESMAPFTEKSAEFMEHVKGSDRLFMSSGVKQQCEAVVESFKELSLGRYPRPPEIPVYPPSGLANVGAALKSLRMQLEEEIYPMHGSLGLHLADRWSRVKERLGRKHAS